MDILENMKKRYATKLFYRNFKVSEEDKEKLLEIWLLTPSAFWLQPWRFVIVEDEQYKKRLRKASYWQPQTRDASFVIILCRVNDYSEKNFIDPYIKDMAEKRNKKVEDYAEYRQIILDFLYSKTKDELDSWATAQVYIALWNMITAAVTMWFDTCPMEWFNADSVGRKFKLEEKWLTPCVMLAVWKANPKDYYQTQAKVRYNKKDMIIKY